MILNLGGVILKKIVAFILVMVFAFSMFLIIKNMLNPEIVAPEIPSEEDHKQHTVYLPPERHIYDIKADYDGKNKIKVDMDFVYVNDTGDVQKELFFHLYPNMFSKRQYVPFFQKDFYRAFPHGYSYGSVEILHVKQDESNVEWSMIEDDQILRLSLNNIIEPEDISNFNIHFKLTVLGPDSVLDIRISARENLQCH